jgi:hypothetical protein
MRVPGASLAHLAANAPTIAQAGAALRPRLARLALGLAPGLRGSMGGTKAAQRPRDERAQQPAAGRGEDGLRKRIEAVGVHGWSSGVSMRGRPRMCPPILARGGAGTPHANHALSPRTARLERQLDQHAPDEATV